MLRISIDDGPPAALKDAVLRLHPAFDTTWEPLSGGRSNRLWRVGDVVVKLYDQAAASPLFPNDAEAEARALRQLAPLGLAPMLRASGPGWLVYEAVPGKVWSDGPAMVARLFSQVHAQRGTGFRHLPSGSAALILQARRIAAMCHGALAIPQVDDLPPVALPRLIHGDAVAGNIIVGQGRATLIDWQCPAEGDPTEDLAAFLSPAMQWLYRGRTLTGAEQAAFLSACPTDVADRYRALAPAFHARMAAHCLWKAERGASDYATAFALEQAALG